MATNKDYCDYATCVALKELGYNYPLELITDYFGVLDIPFHDQKIHLYEAQKWLRKEKKIEVNAAWDNEKSYWFWYINEMTDVDYYDSIVSESIYDSYEEALLESIKKVIKILKEKDND